MSFRKTFIRPVFFLFLLLAGKSELWSDRPVVIPLLVNDLYTNYEGVQYAFIFNRVRGKMTGLQISYFYNYADVFHGFQWTTYFNYVSRSMRGFQLGGLFNMVQGDMKGLQVAPINITGSGEGMMLGFLNVAKEFEGPTFGLINVILNGENRIGVFGDEIGFLNFYAKFGSRYFYNFLNFGLKHDLKSIAYRFGFGTKLTFSRTLFGNLEGTLGSMQRADLPFISQNLLFQIRLGLGLRLAKHFGVIGGISYNHFALTGLNTSQIFPDPLLGDLAFSQLASRHWIGFFLGVEI